MAGFWGTFLDRQDIRLHGDAKNRRENRILKNKRIGEDMKLLIYHKNDYMFHDICNIMERTHISYSVIPCFFEDKYDDPTFWNWCMQNISFSQYDALLSVNYHPILAKLCREVQIKYIAWCYDCPLNVVSIEDTLAYETNYVFFFDRQQYLSYYNRGFQTVHHMSLGVNSHRMSALAYSPALAKKYSCSVSFVGNLYPSMLQEILAPMNPFLQGYLRALMDAQSKLYGCYLLDELLTDDLLEQINNGYKKTAPDTTFSLSKEALSYAMACEITREERLILLNLLGKRHDTKFYSYAPSNLIQNITYGGPLDYVSEMPYAFHYSKVNLNPSLRIIQTGIPLRAFDVMGAGGFLLSNWQEELAENYTDGVDLVLYDSIPDAIEKAAFYLAHEDIRMQITASGRQKTLQEHDLQHILQEILMLSKIE